MYGLRMNRRRIGSLLLAAPLLFVLPACSSTGNAIAKRGFIEAVNLHCRSTKARIEIAAKLTKMAAQTEQGKELTADAQSRVESAKDRVGELIDTIGSIAGPSGLQDDFIAGFEKLRDVPGQVAEGTLTKEEGLAQIEKTRSELREQGFVDCV